MEQKYAMLPQNNRTFTARFGQLPVMGKYYLRATE